MRFLNKFYSFIKSIYLNNSRFSNNLRHTLRIFFEREVKTKHTPTIFGSTFKGSKWVDYQTFNINKLFIKSGLYYFYYISAVILILFLFLGRSKSEQYFGFFPLFSYINFILGYVPIIMSDLTSQIILTFYTIYTVLTLIIQKVLSQFTNNTLNTLKTHYELKNIQLHNTKNTNFSNLFSLSQNNDSIVKKSTFSSIPILSKKLNLVTKNISLETYYNINKNLNNSSKINSTLLITNSINYNTLKLKIKDKYGSKITITDSEAFYTNMNLLSNLKIKNTKTNINDLLKISKSLNNFTFFNFNIKNNLNIAEQQRWLARNSLLSESIIPNSFLITQSKKLIGSGILDKDFSNKSLWLPTKLSKLSPIETNNYINSILNNYSNYKSDTIQYLNNNNIFLSNFNHLNNFENSRFWLFKKYFFTNNQNNNIVVNSNKIFSKQETSPKYNLVYNNNLYLNNILHIVKNNTTPSLNYNYKTLDSTYKEDNKLLYSNVKVNTPQLDIISGYNINLFYSITSNPQHKSDSHSTNYYNVLKSSLNTTKLQNNIKFYKS